MATDGNKTLPEEAPPHIPSSSHTWKDRILLPTLLAGIAGGGFGLVSKHRKVHGLANISATYTTNFAIVTGSYCAGQLGALRYSVIFAVVGTTVDYATLKLKPTLENFRESVKENSEKSGGWLKLPEWPPIQALNQEALSAKKAQEEKLRAQTNLQMKEEA